jgi:hypothetical protein
LPRFRRTCEHDAVSSPRLPCRRAYVWRIDPEERRAMHRPILPALAFALAMCAPTQGIAQEDPAAIRSVIESQLGAFLRDDAEAAWAHASPGIQRMFRSSDIFIGMVRQGYQPVYRPKEWTFGDLRPSSGGPEQEVRIVDAAGESWVAIYTMEKQPDGSWKISGCRLVKAPPNTA